MDEEESTADKPPSPTVKTPLSSHPPSSTKPSSGYTTAEALDQLYEDIEQLLLVEEIKLKQNRFTDTVKYFFTNPYDSPIGWFSIFLTLIAILGLFIGGYYFSACILLLILCKSLGILYREYQLRRTEIHRKVRYALSEINLAKQLCSNWLECNYPNLCSPLSPCVTLQWTYRDGKIVNLPWALLVRGDHIIIRPGQMAPGSCVELNGKSTFLAGETYGLAQPSEPPLKPTARAPLPDLVCVMETTPYLETLRTSLRNFLNRPPTICNEHRHLLVTRYIQQWGCTLSLIITIFTGLIRYFRLFLNTTIALDGMSDSNSYNSTLLDQHWSEIFFTLPVCGILPILPLMFPMMWIAINLWGIARLQTLLTLSSSPSLNSEEKKSFQEDLDTPTSEWEHIPLPTGDVFFNWIQLWQGDSSLLGRSANVVQVLGSITALSCVDKKGILSWPNPTAEKVFFIRDSTNERQQDKSRSSLDTDETSSTDDKIASRVGSGGGGGGGGGGSGIRRNVGGGLVNAGGDHIAADGVGIKNIIGSTATSANAAEVLINKEKMTVIAEVLDLTHDQHSPFRLEFDDHAWKDHINSLKPLGLAILVNTCCPLTQEHYAQFCNHVTAVAMLDKDLVPVTNRYAIVESKMNSFMHGRCLCELAKQIGFTTHARDIFNLEGQIASYMHLQPEVVKRDIRFARHLQLQSKVKVPFPHCLSVVMRESHSGSLQLLTQGTADIVLDCCDDYWDGKDLRPLGPQERKRAQDFYQRSALTAYCTAFSYRPLRHGISGALSGVKGSGNTAYLELPPESKYRMAHHCDPNDPNSDGAATGSGGGGDRLHNHHGHHSISTDSLLFTGNDQRREEDISNVDDCFEMQCHQVFIGMVTMQYQARNDIVQLIERLDQACIRFVHFSKENELRSRVFSEKMGLESGWNCHISLLSKSTSNLSSPKISRNSCPQPSRTVGTTSLNLKNKNNKDCELNRLLPLSGLEASKNLSSSAPGAISNPDCSLLMPNIDDDINRRYHNQNSNDDDDDDDDDEEIDEHSYPTAECKINEEEIESERRSLNDSAIMEDNDEDDDGDGGGDGGDEQNCRSLSCLTDSTEQSAPINFDMSNRAKLPRGIKNIQPHLENVDNVPLLVSLFTDCSADATREMLSIMQNYGEIVVCMGSSASNSNAEIFLQADCSIAVEPLYPQVCQDIPAYTESNIFNNKFNSLGRDSGGGGIDGNGVGGKNSWLKHKWRSTNEEITTISPIYLSRLLNSIPCSISICRDDSLSIVSLIELSRRFSIGVWSCIQFWACCACSLAVMNTFCAIFALPPLFTPLSILYVMCIAVPMLATTLVRTDASQRVMNRATSKKQTKFNSDIIFYVLWCYGGKFMPSILVMLLSYCTLMSHPIDLLDNNGQQIITSLPTNGQLFQEAYNGNLECARSYILFAMILHFVCISMSFIHRDYSIWQKNPLSNRQWIAVGTFLIIMQLFFFCINLLINSEIIKSFQTIWPIVIFLFASVFVIFIIVEICKWEEIKFIVRNQRRARLDFGTKLGMNSPF